jgi:hypothetical protein
VESEPRWFRVYLLTRAVVLLGAGILGVIVTLGSDDSVAGRTISGAVTVGVLYYGVRALRLLRVH